MWSVTDGFFLKVIFKAKTFFVFHHSMLISHCEGKEDLGRRLHGFFKININSLARFHMFWYGSPEKKSSRWPAWQGQKADRPTIPISSVLSRFCLNSKDFWHKTVVLKTPEMAPLTLKTVSLRKFYPDLKPSGGCIVWRGKVKGESGWEKNGRGLQGWWWGYVINNYIKWHCCK